MDSKTKSTLIVIPIVLIVVIIISAVVVYSNDEPSPALLKATQDVDYAATYYLNVCSEAVSIPDLEGCKIKLKEMSDKCKTDTVFEGMVFCNSENQIEQFYSTVDQKITTARDSIDTAAKILEENINTSEMETITQETDEFANQEMVNFIEDCISTDNEAEMQICAGNAKEMLSLCEISNVEACLDPRLQIIADR